MFPAGTCACSLLVTPSPKYAKRGSLAWG
jgi:hypothetical protein